MKPLHFEIKIDLKKKLARLDFVGLFIYVMVKQKDKTTSKFKEDNISNNNNWLLRK